MKPLPHRRGEYYLQYLGGSPDSEFACVHRISLTAAILWATVRANGETKDLRRDALAALQAPRASNVTRQYADGSMDLTLRLKRGPARLVMAACELNDDTPRGFLYRALKEEVMSYLEFAQRGVDTTPSSRSLRTSTRGRLSRGRRRFGDRTHLSATFPARITSGW